ncbi:MAG: hypothetical protein ACM3ZC_10935 [Bacteroidota bacterium]
MEKSDDEITVASILLVLAAFLVFCLLTHDAIMAVGGHHRTAAPGSPSPAHAGHGRHSH